MDKETFTENVPSDAKGGCELEEKHEQSMLSVSQGYNLCRDDTGPCDFAEKCQTICVLCTETSLPIPSSTSPHTPSPPVPVPAPTLSPSNVIAESDPHVASLTDDHRPEGDAPHEDAEKKKKVIHRTVQSKTEGQEGSSDSQVQRSDTTGCAITFERSSAANKSTGTGTSS